MMEEKNEPIPVSNQTTDSEHDLKDDEWSPRQHKLIQKRLYQVRRRTVAHWTMRKLCLTHSQIFTLPSVLLGAGASTTQYSMLGGEIDTPNTNQTNTSNNEIKMIVSVIMTSIMTILAVIVQFFRFHEKSESHREAAINYSEITNRLTQIKYGGPVNLERSFLNELGDIDKDYLDIKSNAPMIPDSLLKDCQYSTDLENGKKTIPNNSS